MLADLARVEFPKMGNNSLPETGRGAQSRSWTDDHFWHGPCITIIVGTADDRADGRTGFKMGSSAMITIRDAKSTRHLWSLGTVTCARSLARVLRDALARVADGKFLDDGWLLAHDIIDAGGHFGDRPDDEMRIQFFNAKRNGGYYESGSYAYFIDLTRGLIYGSVDYGEPWFGTIGEFIARWA
jgi:hypothetical protein